MLCKAQRGNAESDAEAERAWVRIKAGACRHPLVAVCVERAHPAEAGEI